MKIIVALCTLASSFIATIGWAADPLTIPGSRVSLEPPPGFVLSKDFAGLQGEKASVLVAEIPGALYDTSALAIQRGVMAQQGVEITSGEELTGLPFRARMFRGKQKLQSTEMDKWLMLIDGGSALTLINVSAFRDADKLTDDKVRAMFRSVRMAAAPAGDPVDALPFTVTASSNFSRRQALAGTGLVLTAAAPSAAEKGQPALVVSRAFQQPVPADRRKEAVAAYVKSSQALKFDKVDDPKPVKVGPLDGLEFMATGTSGGDPARALVTMVFTPTGGYVMMGMASPDRFNAALPDFKTMMASFRLK